MEISIRTVTENDAASIVELLNPIIQAGTFTIMAEPFSVEDQIEFIRNFPQRGIYHIAIDNRSHQVLGIQDVMPISTCKALRHVGEISTFVALDSHKQGIGQNLFQTTFKAAMEHGFLKLRATVRGDNPYALSFYQGQGFEVIGVAKKHAFLHGRYVDEVLFEKFM